MGLKESLKAVLDLKRIIGSLVVLAIGTICAMILGFRPVPDSIKPYWAGLFPGDTIKKQFHRCPGDTTVSVTSAKERYEVLVTLPFIGHNREIVEGYARAIANDSIRGRFNDYSAGATMNGLRQSLAAGSYDAFYRYADSLSQQYLGPSYLRETGLSTTITADSCYQVKVSANIVNSEYGAGTMALRPAFRLEAKLDQDTFINGDNIIISLSASENCYVTVFNFQSSGDSLQVLAPTQGMPRNNISMGERYQLPPPQSLFPLGVFLRKDQLSDKRLIFAIATKGQDLPLPPEYASAALLPADGAIKAMKDWLVGLEAHNVAVAAVKYEVIASGPKP